MKLSIITINLNNAKGLELTIKSVIHQTFHNYEYLIIDGGSSDDSVNIIKKYENRITFWLSEKDNGIYNAQNKGIKHACGEYCLFLNSGDILVNNDVLESVFKNQPKEDLLYGEGIFNRNGKEVSYKYPDENHLTFRFLKRTALCHPSIFFKRKLFDIYGYYNEEYMIAADWDFYLQLIFKYNVSILKLNLPISKFDSTGLSHSPLYKNKIKLEVNAILNKNFRYFLKDYEELERLDHSYPIRIYRFIKEIIFAPIKIFNRL